jgi:hypothetical protein
MLQGVTPAAIRGSDPQQRGSVLRFRVQARGYAGEHIYFASTLESVGSPGTTRAGSAAEQPCWPTNFVRLTQGRLSGSGTCWIADPPVAGTYRIRLSAYSPYGPPLDSRATPPFVVRP